eukprot:scaffold115358_cov22-Tisochrysis_lutea.AAC.1
MLKSTCTCTFISSREPSPSATCHRPRPLAHSLYPSRFLAVQRLPIETRNPKKNVTRVTIRLSSRTFDENLYIVY